jgi:hypothetical protein
MRQALTGGVVPRIPKTRVFGQTLLIKMKCFAKTLRGQGGFALVFLMFMGLRPVVTAQTAYLIDQFNSSGPGVNSYAAGQITNVWGELVWRGDSIGDLGRRQ